MEAKIQLDNISTQLDNNSTTNKGSVMEKGRRIVRERKLPFAIQETSDGSLIICYVTYIEVNSN